MVLEVGADRFDEPKKGLMIVESCEKVGEMGYVLNKFLYFVHGGAMEQVERILRAV